jgi:hypothetical protein
MDVPKSKGVGGEELWKYSKHASQWFIVSVTEGTLYNLHSSTSSFAKKVFLFNSLTHRPHSSIATRVDMVGTNRDEVLTL